MRRDRLAGESRNTCVSTIVEWGPPLRGGGPTRIRDPRHEDRRYIVPCIKHYWYSVHVVSDWYWYMTRSDCIAWMCTRDSTDYNCTGSHTYMTWSPTACGRDERLVNAVREHHCSRRGPAPCTSQVTVLIPVVLQQHCTSCGHTVVAQAAVHHASLETHQHAPLTMYTSDVRTLVIYRYLSTFVSVGGVGRTSQGDPPEECPSDKRASQSHPLDDPPGSSIYSDLFETSKSTCRNFVRET